MMVRSLLLSLAVCFSLLRVAAAQAEPAPLAPPPYAPSPSPDAFPHDPLPHYPGAPPQPTTLPATDWVQSKLGVPYPPPVATRVLPNPPPPPQPPTANPPSSTPVASRPLPPMGAKVHHLRQAADHLDAAGLKDQAAALRRQAKQQEQSTLLAEKLRQLEKLQAEIATLREGPPVLVSIAVAEYRSPSARLGKDDLEMLEKVLLPSRIEGTRGGFTHGNTSKLSEAWSKLTTAGVLKTIAEPKILAVSGREASFFSGGEMPISSVDAGGQQAIRYQPVGLQVDVLPICEDRFLRLEVRTRQSRLADSGVTTRESDVMIDFRPGTSAILACYDAPATDVKQISAGEQTGDKPSLLIFVTPSIVSGDDVAPPIRNLPSTTEAVSREVVEKPGAERANSVRPGKDRPRRK